jgi:hypothetical protein
MDAGISKGGKEFSPISVTAECKGYGILAVFSAFLCLFVKLNA